MYNGRCYVLEFRKVEFVFFEMEYFKIFVKVNYFKVVVVLIVGIVFYIYVFFIIGYM